MSFGEYSKDKIKKALFRPHLGRKALSSSAVPPKLPPHAASSSDS